MNDSTKTLLVYGALGVGGYFLVKALLDKLKGDAPVAGSEGSYGGLTGLVTDLVVGAAPKPGSKALTPSKGPALKAGQVRLADGSILDAASGTTIPPPPPLEVNVLSPSQGGTVSHTPFRDTFPMRLELVNNTATPVADELVVQCRVDASWLPTGVSTTTTTHYFELGSSERRLVELPVTLSDNPLALGAFGWDVDARILLGSREVARISFSVN